MKQIEVSMYELTLDEAHEFLKKGKQILIYNSRFDRYLLKETLRSFVLYMSLVSDLIKPYLKFFVFDLL